jgi:hypothetical protein
LDRGRDWTVGMTSRFRFARPSSSREHHRRPVTRRTQPHFLPFPRRA